MEYIENSKIRIDKKEKEEKKKKPKLTDMFFGYSNKKKYHSNNINVSIRKKQFGRPA